MPDEKIQVRIRMYRPGLGDCFLLTFFEGDDQRHILIDCGIFVGTANEKDWMIKIAEEIKKTTRGRLHALVATHEHWDHVAGFHYAKDIFDGEENISIDEVWLAWTEDPDQQVVQERRKQKEKLASTLAQAVQHLAGFGSLEEQECGRAIADVLAFNGPAADEEPISGSGPASQLFAAFSKRSNAAMEHLFDLKDKKGPNDYLKPGDLLTPSWLPGVRVFVLGPPQNLDFLGEMEGSPETEQYLDDREAAVAAAQNWQSAVEQTAIKTGGFYKFDIEPPEPREVGIEEASFEEASFEVQSPLEGELKNFERLEAELKEAAMKEAALREKALKEAALREAAREEVERQETFNREHRWSEAELLALKDGDNDFAAAMIASYRSEDWRRIDSAWYNNAARLALQLDKATNNTSLVLAFELIDSGQVLLFVGDAQIGNWQSWDNLSWEILDKSDKSGEKKTVTTKYLLEQTVFYKVGHHGSINATRRKNGLELMTNPHLVAAVPTDREFSDNKGWEMPADNLKKELLKKTRGRLLLADNPRHPENTQGLSKDSWDSFRNRVIPDKENETPLFIDYIIR